MNAQRWLLIPYGYVGDVETRSHADFGGEALQQYIEGGIYNAWTADPDNASE